MRDDVIRQAESQLFHFCPDDSRARFDVRLGDFHDDARGEAPADAILEAGKEHWMLIRREDYLFVVVVHRVEEVEKLFLGPFLLCHELDVIHDEDVVLAVLVFELVRAAARDRIDEIDRKTLGTHVKDLLIAVRFLEMITDRLDEVGFPVPRRAVDKERVIGETRAFDDRLCGRMCKLIERSHDERVERVARIQVIAFVDIQGLKVEGGILLCGRMFLGPSRFSRRTVDDIFDGADTVIQAAKRA